MDTDARNFLSQNVGNSQRAGIIAGPDRLRKLSNSMVKLNLSNLLITNLTNIRYLSGFTGSAAILLVQPKNPQAVLLCTDGRYSAQAEEQLGSFGLGSSEIFIGGVQQQFGQVLSCIEDGDTLALESNHVSWSRVKALEESSDGRIAFTGTTSLVEALRTHKDSSEIEDLKVAASIADLALGAILGRLLHEPTEFEFAAELDYQMKMGGAQEPSFETIVASGPNSAMPHARPGTRVIREGDVLVVDFGATFNGYHSDMTRSFVLGEPISEVRQAMEVLIESQRAGVNSAQPGVELRSIDDACRAVLRLAGLEEYFIHGTGHGIGLEIHEEPYVGMNSNGTLDEGHLITVEPGIYFPGRFGLRIEDSLVVEDNSATVITNAPKDWILT